VFEQVLPQFEGTHTCMSEISKVGGCIFHIVLYRGRDDLKTQIGIPHSEVIMLIPSLLSFSLV
jgi:hypothetical protein